MKASCQNTALRVAAALFAAVGLAVVASAEDPCLRSFADRGTGLVGDESGIGGTGLGGDEGGIDGYASLTLGRMRLVVGRTARRLQRCEPDVETSESSVPLTRAAGSAIVLTAFKPAAWPTDAARRMESPWDR